MEENEKRSISKKILKPVVIAFIAIIVCVVVGITGFTMFYLFNTSSKSNYLNVTAAEPTKDGIVNILVAGVDVGSNNNIVTTSDDSAVTTVSTTSNKTKMDNSIFLFSYDQKNKKLKVISIPRDTMIKINEERKKLSYSDSIDGPKYLVNTVENLYKIKINYYAGLDYSAFKNVVDALGGVDLTINNKMDYDDIAQNLHIHFTKGSTVHLDGEYAEQYFRWVKNNDGTGLASGDIGRIKNQQVLAQAVSNKFSRLSTIFKYPEIISTISKNLETNMSPGQIIGYARTFSKLQGDNISYVTASGYNVNINDNKYYLSDSSANNKLLATSTAASSTTSLDKASLKIILWNGTNTNGLAKNYKAALANKGFTSVTSSNPPSTVKKPVDSTKIVFYGMDDNKLIQICNDFGSTFKMNNLELDSKKNSYKSDVIVTLGNDSTGTK